MAEVKEMLRADFRAHIQALLFQKTFMQIIADTTLGRPFHEIVLEVYQEVLDDYKKILLKEKDNGKHKQSNPARTLRPRPRIKNDSRRKASGNT